VERESGGDIVIQIHPSARLFVDKEVPGAVSSGAVEMGVVSLTQYAPLRPATGLVNLPFLFDDAETVEAATAPGHPIRATLDKEILATGARPLWWQPFGMAIMLGRDQAPTRPELLRSRKTRVFGTTMRKFVAAMGGQPVAISGSKQFDAYKRGDVDFGMTGVTAVKSRKLHDVMGHLVKTNHAALEFVVVINEALWRRLTDRERSILGTAAVTVEHQLRLSYRDTHRNTLTWISGNTGMTVSDLTAAERAA
jgi:C4-dicarboxylate-binding protein DctP